MAGVLALAGMALSGCGDDAPADDGGLRDAGRDSGRDAATSDASMDDASMDDGGAGTCGDGVIEGVEACDDGEENSDTAPDSCRTDCTLAACGDDVADTGETCDGDDILGRTCVDESFMSGVLRCAADCSAFDTTMCSNDPGPVCGDGTIEGTEECDGTEIAGRTCDDEMTGTVGTITCASDCTFDSSACSLCGNGVIDTGETCDGTELGGATCPSGGTLACTATCTLDMSGCTTAMTCGNDIAEGTEACDGTDLRAATCVSRGFTGGALACTTCVYDESGCTGATATPTMAGQIVITEIMQNPAALADNDGEWFELHNPGTAALNLNGCVFTDGGTNTFTVASDVLVAAGSYVTFAKAQTAAAARGFTPDYEYPVTGYTLANGADSIVLTCGATMIDTVAWDGGPMFPDPDGATMSLSPSNLSATDNDDGGNWCEATSTYGTGATPDRGTPGAANDVCVAAPVYTVSFCRLQFPETINEDIGTPTTVYGRVYAAGLTDMTDATDVSPSLLASVGYGPDGSDPATSTDWTWTAATPNVGWNDAAENNNDEYQATLVAPAPAGAYDYAYRFSGDSGATWVHCDSLAAGSSDGYQVANAGAMTTTTPPVVSCSVVINEVQAGGTGANDEFVEIYNPCLVAVDLTGHRLVYRSATGTSDVALSTFPAVSIPAGEYRIYTGSAYSGAAASDGSMSGSLAAGGGGVAVLNATGMVVDSVGYGSATNAFVETTAAAVPPGGSSIARTPNGSDTDVNSVDFMVDATPTPRATNL